MGLLYRGVFIRGDTYVDYTTGKSSYTRSRENRRSSLISQVLEQVGNRKLDQPRSPLV